MILFYFLWALHRVSQAHTIDSFYQTVLHYGAALCIVGCSEASPVGHSTFSNSAPRPAGTTKNVSRHCQVSLGGQKCPQLRTIGLT